MCAILVRAQETVCCVFVCQARCLPTLLQERDIFQCVSFSCERRRQCVVYSCVRLGASLLVHRTCAFFHSCRSRVSVGPRPVLVEL